MNTLLIDLSKNIFFIIVALVCAFFFAVGMCSTQDRCTATSLERLSANDYNDGLEFMNVLERTSDQYVVAIVNSK
jgi:hypothetical protein